jgi:RNA polymerase sigma factor (sigma-70 family)
MRVMLKCTPPLSQEEEVFLFAQLASARRTIEALGAKKRKRTPQESSQLGTARQVTRENRRKIAEANTPLVLKLANKFFLPGVELDDLIGDGVHKLLQCIDMFDIEKGNRFCTYLYRALVFLYLRGRSSENETWRKRVDDEENLILGNVPTAENENADDLMELRSVLETNKAGLTKVEMTVIRLSFERTQHEISLITKLSKAKIQEVQESAVEKLRKVMVK